MIEPNVTYREIKVNDHEARMWACPLLEKFGQQFAKDIHRMDARTKTVYKNDDYKPPTADYRLDKGCRYWFILVDEIPAGYILIDPEFTLLRDDMHVMELYIDPPFRSKGYGKQLLQYAIAETRKINPRLRRVSLSVLDKNVTAQKLYKKLGFTPLSTVMLKDF